MTRPAGTTRPRRRPSAARRLAVAVARVLGVLLLLAGLVLGGLWWHNRPVEPGEYVAPSPTTSSASAPSTSTPSPTSSSSRQTTDTTAYAGKPQSVTLVSSAGETLVSTRLVPTYLDDRGVLAPPAGIGGWYAERGWVHPGQVGTAILVGHINHGGRADVFWNLPSSKPGDRVTVRYANGAQAAFRVTASQALSKTEVPKRTDIWDSTARTPQLRLITCDPTTPLNGGHYAGNWVVWAEPETSQAPGRH